MIGQGRRLAVVQVNSDDGDGDACTEGSTVVTRHREECLKV